MDHCPGALDCGLEHAQSQIIMNPPGKKVAVLGLGVSGYESAIFLHKKGFEVFASDGGSSAILEERAENLRRQGIEVETGDHSLVRILNSDWILISPGIAPSTPVYQSIVKQGIPAFSEIEVASWYTPSRRMIAVTGSSGKTTVSTLLSRVLQKKFGRAFLCGNIGNPWIAELERIHPDDFVVIEISSFQLIHCFSFRPAAALLLNISLNHQDWHKDMQEYVQAKLRIFQSQTPQDHAVIRRADQVRFFSAYRFPAQLHFFGESEVDPNEEAVTLTAGLFGCEPEIAGEVIRQFEGIEHRLEKFGSWQGIDFVNDSKSTTPSSLAWALEKFPDKSVVLIAGGHPKSGGFEELRPLIARKVRAAILIGEAASLLGAAWEGAASLMPAGTHFQEAVRKACGQAKPGDTVLLSPACASFDMFKNYQDRGQIFKKLVRETFDFCHFDDTPILGGEEKSLGFLGLRPRNDVV